MKKNTFIILLFILSILSSCTYQKTSTELFNDGWQFVISDKTIENIADESGWIDVSLPHNPIATEKVMAGQWQGICWYKKTFTLPESAKNQHLFFRFDGAMNVSEFWVNGHKMAKHYGGYLPVVFDFIDASQIGENTIFVKLDNTDSKITGPKPINTLDFNMNGGLYRNAWLISKNNLHITEPNASDNGGGIFVTYPDVSDSVASVKVQVNVANSGNKKESFIVINELWDGSKKLTSYMSKKSKLASNASADITTIIPVDNPRLWSPQHPQFYTLKTKIVVNGHEVDEEETRIGIRRIKFTKDYFSINGEKMFLRGVNRHQEYPYVGYAMSDAAQYRDAVKIKEAGFDYVRLSHYPHSPAFMDACDELGLVVIDAILGWQYYINDSLFQSHIYETARNLVRRDRNHPCVIAWEVSLNESWMDEYFIDSLCSIAHTEYPGDQCYTAGWQRYGFDIYLQARQHRLGHYKEIDKPYIVSEYGDWEYYAQNAGLNQDRWGNLKQEERSSRQLLTDGEKRLLQQATNIQEAHNDNFTTSAIADGYWVMFDYNRGYSPDLEASGIMTIDRLPKFSYYFYRSQRSASEVSDLYSCGPMVKIASYWQENSSLNVRIYSNADEVELFLNGLSLGKQQPYSNKISDNLVHPSFIFNIKKFEPGELLAKAYINGKEVATDEVRTPSTPQKLTLRIDESGKAPQAGVNDVIFVYASVIDEYGTVVPVNGEVFNFTIDGDAQIQNVGDITTEAGIATALVKIGNQKSEIIVIAKSKNICEATVRFIPE